jgi:hypothetical protein
MESGISLSLCFEVRKTMKWNRHTLAAPGLVYTTRAWATSGRIWITGACASPIKYTLYGPDLHLDVFRLQEPAVLLLGVSTLQRHELHLDVSGKQEPVLVRSYLHYILTWAAHVHIQTIESCAAPGLVYTTEACAGLDMSTSYRVLSCIWIWTTGACAPGLVCTTGPVLVWTCLHHRGLSRTLKCLHCSTDAFATPVHVCTTGAWAAPRLVWTKGACADPGQWTCLHYGAWKCLHNRSPCCSWTYIVSTLKGTVKWPRRGGCESYQSIGL